MFADTGETQGWLSVQSRQDPPAGDNHPAERSLHHCRVWSTSPAARQMLLSHHLLKGKFSFRAGQVGQHRHPELGSAAALPIPSWAAEGAGAEVEAAWCCWSSSRRGCQPRASSMPAGQDPVRPRIASRARQRRRNPLRSSRNPARSSSQQIRPNAAIYTTTYL